MFLSENYNLGSVGLAEFSNKKAMFYSLIWIALHTPVLLFLGFKWFWLKDEREELKSRLPEVMRLLIRINIGFGVILLADLFITELLTPMLLA